MFFFSPDITSPLPFNSNLYVLPVEKSLYFKHSIKLTLHYNQYVPSPVKKIQSPCIPSGVSGFFCFFLFCFFVFVFFFFVLFRMMCFLCVFFRHYMFIFKTLYQLYHSIPIYMYPLLGKCLFSIHYITSSTPFKSICTPSWVSFYFQI